MKKTIVSLVILVLFDVQFIRMMPQGYADAAYWVVLACFVGGTFFLIFSLYANTYMEKHKWDVVTLNDIMNESYDLEDYFKNRDELISYLSKMAKIEFVLNKGNRLTEKPSILLQKLEENESKSVRSAILRMTAHYKRLVQEKKHEFSELFSDALRDYSHRLSKENIQEMELCLKILKDYERVCGKIEATDGMDGHDFEYWCAELLKKADSPTWKSQKEVAIRVLMFWPSKTEFGMPYSASAIHPTLGTGQFRKSTPEKHSTIAKSV